MDTLNAIIDFVKDISGIDEINPESDIFDLDVVGDDFYEMIEKYSESYEVDMSEYLWYFHADEEGQNFGGLFFKPPYRRVNRIPVTPRLLSEFAKTKKWSMKYPEHKLPNKRIDITINQILVVVFIIIVLVIWVLE